MAVDAFRAKVRALLAKTENIDKDERFMATSDRTLCSAACKFNALQ